ncbi:leucine-rich repeat-containing protein 15-like [Diachasma alloeum]|uniref:leucine-rich repeat-containing protein 15-like n=1 Tax=Diachasma alloeum TaxID=454923 RepID=UPI0007383DC5|nr:leucine-rich repeat-containing protein 15-like [Diachasma alloeum]
MKIIIGAILTSLVSSALGQDEVCKSHKGLNICEKSTTTITSVKVEERSALHDGILELSFDGDTTIGPKAFSVLELRGFLLMMPYSNERILSALPTLTLHPDTFVGSSNISRIFVLRANVNLIGESFTSMTQLQYLRFMYCGFTEVPTRMLESTPNLDELSFENNYIRAVRPHAFAPLKRLRELHLEGNGIVSLELGCFDGLDQLRVLNLADNHFTATPGIFNGLNKVFRLDIENAFDENGFNIDILRDLPALGSMRMGHNNVTSLEPDMFAIVPELENLSLYGNHITSVPKGVFDRLKSLYLLHLAANDVGSIEPGAFSGLNMTVLYLLDNRVDKTIETGTFSGLSVHELNLECSNVTELKPRAFDGLSAQEVNLSHNKLTQVGADDFSGLDTEELKLRDNGISSIAPNAFKNTKVKKLDLSENPIREADKDKWGLPASTEVLMY